MLGKTDRQEQSVFSFDKVQKAKCLRENSSKIKGKPHKERVYQSLFYGRCCTRNAWNNKTLFFLP